MALCFDKLCLCFISMPVAHIYLGQFQKYFLYFCIPAKDQNHPHSRSLNCEGYTSGITLNSFSVDGLYEFQTHPFPLSLFLKCLEVKTTNMFI